MNNGKKKKWKLGKNWKLGEKIENRKKNQKSGESWGKIEGKWILEEIKNRFGKKMKIAGKIKIGKNW